MISKAATRSRCDRYGARKGPRWPWAASAIDSGALDDIVEES